MKLVYFDMDGVLADFERGFKTKMGIAIGDASSAEVADFWNNAHKYFFKYLPPINAGIAALVEVSEICEAHTLASPDDPAHVAILTSCGRADTFASIVGDKAFWLCSQVKVTPELGTQMRFPMTFVQNSPQKKMFAHRNAMLIDDHKANADEWRSAGGIAFRWKQPDKTNHEDLIRAVGRFLEGRE